MTNVSQETLVTEGSGLLDALLSRQSYSLLCEPAPNDDEINLIVDAALRAPDHGRLRPWLFLVIRDTARSALAEMMVEALAHTGNTQEATLNKIRKRIAEVPLIIGAGAKIKAESPIPEIEQLLSAGAATMNILNAVHALGYGAKWVTPGPIYDLSFNKVLGLTWPDRLIGLIFVGSKPKQQMPTVDRPVRNNHLKEWRGIKGHA